jgi:hypothetical protein
MSNTPKITPSVREYFRVIGKSGCQSRLRDMTPEQRKEFASKGGKAKRKTKILDSLAGTPTADNPAQ